MLGRLLSYAWYLLAGLLVLIALVVSLARLVLPAMGGYRAELESQVSDYLALPVRVAQMDAAWRGFKPVLRFKGVRVEDADGRQTLLEVDEVGIALDPWSSLQQGRWVLGGVTLSGTHLALARGPSGQLGLVGFPVMDVAPDWLGALLGLGQVALRDSSVSLQDERLMAGPISLSQVNAQLRNQGGQHHLQASLTLPEQLGGRVDLLVDVRRPTHEQQAFKSVVYLKSAATNLQGWVEGLFPDADILQGRVDLEAWVELQDNAATRVRARLGAQDLLHLGEQDHRLGLKRVDGVLEWQRRRDGWSLDVRPLQVISETGPWPETGLRLVASDREQADARHWRGEVEHLDLAGLTQLLLGSGLLPEASQTLLTGLQPEGRVDDLRFELGLDGQGLQQLALSSQLGELTTRAWEKLPGLRGISASIAGDLEHGQLRLHSESGAFEAPRLFREPLALRHLDGHFHWDRPAGGLRFFSSGVDIANEDLVTRSRLELQWPAAGGAPFIDMQVHFRDGDAGHTSRYLPVGIMPPAAVQWLDRALVSGRITSGGMLFHGPANRFPFDGGEGRFLVDFNVEQMVLDYREGWTRIEELAAGVRFQNRAMQIDAVAGKVLGTELSEVSAHISDLLHAHLSVAGKADGPLRDMLRFVRESPLSDAYGNALGPVEMAGEAGLSLTMELPLSSGKHQVNVKGQVDFHANRLSLTDWDLNLEDMTGPLKFTEHGVSARQLHARLRDQPVSLQIRPLSGLQGGTRLDLKGPLGLVALLHGQGGAGLSRYLKGNSLWALKVEIPRYQGKGAPSPVSLRLASELQGVAVELPAPLGKPAAASRPFVMETQLTGKTLAPLRLRYGEDVSAVLEFTPGQTPARLQRGELRFGGDVARPPEQGFRIAGQLAEVSLADWLAVLDAAGSGAAASTGASLVNAIDLRVDRLQAWDRELGSVQISAQATGRDWDLRLDSAPLAGRLQWQTSTSAVAAAAGRPAADGGRLILELDRLILAESGAGHATADPAGHKPVAGPPRFGDPARLPVLKADIKRFVYHDVDLGTLRFTTQPVPGGLRVDQLALESELLKLNASGDWLTEAAGQHSRFDIQFKDAQLGQLLESFGYAGSVRDGKTHGELQASWPGGPSDFALARADGRLSLEIDKGRLVDVEPGAGRVFGLLSLHSLSRRLLLDFSDLFSKGFSFDRIAGHFTLVEGNAFTNDLTVQGPSAEIQITGRTGLAAEDYDQRVTVLPRVGSSLPLAGALAGGPGVGAALLLADKLFPKQLAELTSFSRVSYTLTGSWDAPQLQRVDRSEP